MSPKGSIPSPSANQGRQLMRNKLEGAALALTLVSGLLASLMGIHVIAGFSFAAAGLMLLGGLCR